MAAGRGMSVEVLAAGFASSLQDAGRPGLRRFGVASGGALDPWAFALANLLAGNAADAVALEVTLAGPTLRFPSATRVALCGATIDADVDGTPVPGARPIDLPAGSVLRLGPCRDGARTYLAVYGGIMVQNGVGGVPNEYDQRAFMATGSFIGLALIIAGAALFIRYSIARYLRFWLIRLVHESHANTDRIVEAIERASGQR